MGVLGATYAVHLSLIEKLILDFLFVLIEPFSLGRTAEALRVNIDWKSAVSKGGGSVCAKISARRGRPSPTIFARLHRLVNAIQQCH